MTDRQLHARNAALTALLARAGVEAQASAVAEQLHTVLVEEIHHRMKNMLAMVTAIVRQSMRAAATLPEAEATISARLMAMSNAHELLLKADLRTASLSAVIQGAIDQHNTAAGRIDVTGAELEVMPSAILPLTLVLNELCTNAAKYGALSNDSGRVSLAWQADLAGAQLIFTWVESGGPPVSPPSR